MMLPIIYLQTRENRWMPAQIGTPDNTYLVFNKYVLYNVSRKSWNQFDNATTAYVIEYVNPNGGKTREIR